MTNKAMTDTLEDFAIACYRHAGVAECCLRLQDRVNADVNMLLAAAWLAGRHLGWEREHVHDLIAHCADWREHCISPLRTVRRYLKGRDNLKTLYTRAKALELDAELHQLQLLHAALTSMPLRASAEPGATVLAANLHIYVDSLPVTGSETTKAERRALVDTLGQEIRRAQTANRDNKKPAPGGFFE